MTASAALSTPGGARVALGAELGRGGEGAVFAVQGKPDQVAKIYHRPPAAATADKLAAMCRSGTPALSKLAAWPADLVQERGRTVGFLMPGISGYRAAFELYGTKPRLQNFPRADYRFLVAAAANTARAFAAVHAVGQVIGDINHGNLMVGQDATVRLIDCDSFQIALASRTWFCEVGVPVFQPPEMQGLKSYGGFTRTPNHDAFGLAVMVFHLLCISRHPYAGVWQGAGDPLPLEENIRAFRYAYASDRTSTRTVPPPGSLPVEALGPQVRRMFEEAFLAPGARPGGRPSAVRWVAALEALGGSLRQCSANAAHHHVPGLSACPWCTIESGGVTLFPAVSARATPRPGTAGTVGAPGAGAVDGFLLLWRQVATVDVPPPRGMMPGSPPAEPTDEAVAMGRRRAAILAAGVAACGAACFAVHLLAAAGVALPLMAVLVLVSAGVLMILAFMTGSGFRADLDAARTEWSSVISDWMDKAAANRPNAILESLDAMRTDYDAAVAERKSRLAALQADRHASQLAAHMARCRIAGAGIKGVGDGKAATLQSHGIETAADVVEWRILQIPGFGPVTVGHLMAWRRAREAAFRFDPSKPVPRSEIDRVENAFTGRAGSLERKLASGLADLRSACASEIRTRAAILHRFRRLEPVYNQAVANARAALWHA